MPQRRADEQRDPLVVPPEALARNPVAELADQVAAIEAAALAENDWIDETGEELRKTTLKELAKELVAGALLALGLIKVAVSGWAKGPLTAAATRHAETFAKVSVAIVVSAIGFGATTAFLWSRLRGWKSRARSRLKPLRQALELLPVVQKANSGLLRQIQAAIGERNELLARVSAGSRREQDFNAAILAANQSTSLLEQRLKGAEARAHELELELIATRATLEEQEARKEIPKAALRGRRMVVSYATGDDRVCRITRRYEGFESHQALEIPLLLNYVFGVTEVELRELQLFDSVHGAHEQPPFAHRPNKNLYDGKILFDGVRAKAGVTFTLDYIVAFNFVRNASEQRRQFADGNVPAYIDPGFDWQQWTSPADLEELEIEFRWARSFHLGTPTLCATQPEDTTPQLVEPAPAGWDPTRWHLRALKVRKGTTFRFRWAVND